MMRGALVVLVVVSAQVVAACGDPVRTTARDALGPEAPGVRRGPLHRPGQPCLVCHNGGEAPEFSIAGTLYVAPGAKTPLVNGTVTLEDAAGTRVATGTNCAGNFYLSPSQFSPTWPVKASVSYGGATTPMYTFIRREGSCSSCHADPPGPGSVGHLYVTTDTTAQVPTCQ